MAQNPFASLGLDVRGPIISMLDEQIESARKRLEDANLGRDETQIERGQIRALRAIRKAVDLESVKQPRPDRSVPRNIEDGY